MLVQSKRAHEFLTNKGRGTLAECPAGVFEPEVHHAPRVPRRRLVQLVSSRSWFRPFRHISAPLGPVACPISVQLRSIRVPFGPFRSNPVQSGPSWPMLGPCRPGEGRTLARFRSFSVHWTNFGPRRSNPCHSSSVHHGACQSVSVGETLAVEHRARQETRTSAPESYDLRVPRNKRTHFAKCGAQASGLGEKWSRRCGATTFGPPRPRHLLTYVFFVLGFEKQQKSIGASAEVNSPNANSTSMKDT